MTAAQQGPGQHDVYTHGHHEAVLRSHRWRTAENSADHLLPVLEPHLTLLDVGCGPGTITVDLARRVAHVVGVDASASVVEAAREAATQAGVTTVAFQVADAYRLPFADDSFDVVHAHQVLQHLSDPVAALDLWRQTYLAVTRSNHADADAGRKLAAWVRAAGFDPAGIAPGAAVWCYATPEDRRWWSQLWAERTVASDFAAQAVERGLATEQQLAQAADGWRRWGSDPDGWFAVLHGHVVARA